MDAFAPSRPLFGGEASAEVTSMLDRAMQSYEITFIDNGRPNSMGGSSIILSPDNRYLKEFMGR